MSSRLSCLQGVAKGIMMVLLHYTSLSRVRNFGFYITACDGCLASRNLYRSPGIDLKISWFCVQRYSTLADQVMAVNFNQICLHRALPALGKLWYRPGF